MATTIINDAATVTITPLTVLGETYTSARKSGNIITEIPGSSDVIVTFRPATLRSGTLDLVFPDAATAHDALNAFTATGATGFTFTEGGLAQVGMRFVLAGDDLTLQPDRVTRRQWILSIPYQEIPA